MLKLLLPPTINNVTRYGNSGRSLMTRSVPIDMHGTILHRMQNSKFDMLGWLDTCAILDIYQ